MITSDLAGHLVIRHIDIKTTIFVTLILTLTHYTAKLISRNASTLAIFLYLITNPLAAKYVYLKCQQNIVNMVQLWRIYL